MADEKLDTEMLRKIQEQLADAKDGRAEVLNSIGMLNLKYDHDRELRETKEDHINKRLDDIEEFRKKAVNGLIIILMGIAITVATSVASAIHVTQNNGGTELVKELIQEIKSMNKP